MAKRKSTAIVQLKLRLRENLRAQLEASAKKGGHSLNQDIVNRLAASFAMEEIMGLSDKVDQVNRALDDMRAKLQAVVIHGHDGVEYAIRQVTDQVADIKALADAKAREKSK